MRWPRTRWSKPKRQEKLNPAQEDIQNDTGSQHWSEANAYSSKLAFQNIPEVQRGVCLIVDSCAEINIDVKKKVNGVGLTESVLKPAKINKLLNYEPNPFQDINQFRSNIITDLILDGDAFIYWDGAHLYNIPANKMEIVSHPRTFIDHYKYGETIFQPNEIIHIKEPNADNMYRGASRLKSVESNIKLIGQMTEFQSTFLKNGTVSNIVLQTESVLSPKIKERILRDWSRKYSANRGGKLPIILDGNFQVKTLGAETMKELDFEASLEINADAVLKALGVPKILLTSGNNANIAPNVHLFYTSTVLPLVNRTIVALERFFGFDLKVNIADVIALRPELAQLSTYYSTLTNAGILSRNEARVALRYPEVDNDIGNNLFLPQNIAGSALDGGVGGRPTGSDSAVEPANQNTNQNDVQNE